MTHRPKQVASTLRRAIQTVLTRGLADPRIQGMITITDIEVSSDLRHARVLISVYPDKYETKTIKGLRNATLRIQRKVNDLLALRRPPHIRFEIDKSMKAQADIMSLLHKAQSEYKGDEKSDISESNNDVLDTADDTDTGLRETNSSESVDDFLDEFSKNDDTNDSLQLDDDT